MQNTKRSERGDACPMSVPPIPRRKSAPAVHDEVNMTVGTETNRCGWSTPLGFTRTLKKVRLSPADPLDQAGVVLASDGKNAWIDTSDTHTVILGSTGSQKSRRVCMPTISMLARAGEPMVVADCKGELYAETIGVLEAYGYKVYNLNLRDPTCSDGWNPLAVPYRMYHSENGSDVSKAQKMVYELADLMSPLVGTDPYWDQAAQDVIAGAIFLMFETCNDVSQVNINGIQSVISMIANRDSSLYDYMRNLDAGSAVYNCLSGPMYNADNTQKCILGMARKSIRPFISHTVISSLLADNGIEPVCLTKEKTAVFITVPDDSKTFNILVSTFIKQAYCDLVEVADSRKERRLKNNVTFLLDEFGSFPAIPDMDSMITAARSRGIRFVFVLQGMDQLSYRYGQEVANTILGNCSNLVFINSREFKLLDYIAELVGEDVNGRRLISTSRLQRLDKESGEMLVFHSREYPYMSNLVDISEYGLPKGETQCSIREHPVPELFRLEWKRLKMRMLEEMMEDMDDDDDDEDD